VDERDWEDTCDGAREMTDEGAERLAPAHPHAAEPGPARAADERFAAELRGFGPVGILAIVVILAGNLLFLPLSGLLVLAWAAWSRTPWREIGYVRPRSWAGGLAVGVAFGVAFKLVMKAVVMPLLGADPVNQAYHYLAGNLAALPWAIFAMIAGAGFGEETVFRGFLFERLGRLFGQGTAAKTAIVLVTTAVFAAAHYPDQGLAGAEQAAFTGLVFR
jgi:CAAX protease family protein